eukprot:56663_1
MAFCVETTNLKPFILIIAGIYIQFWITSFIATIPNESPKNKSKWSVCKKKMIKIFKIALTIWQIVCIIIVFILDIYDFINYTMDNDHKSNTEWRNFNCFVEILVNSSNVKTCFAGFACLLTWFGEIDIMLQQDALHLSKLLVNQNSNGNIGTWNQVKIIQKKYGTLFAMLALEYLTLFFVYSAVIFPTHWFPASICYIWVWLSLLAILSYIIVVPMLIFTRLCNKCVNVDKYLHYLMCCVGFTTKHDMEHIDEGIAIGKSPFGLITLVVGNVMICTLSQCYWYLGDSYVNALITVLTERNMILYFQNVREKYAKMFRLCTTLF